MRAFDKVRDSIFLQCFIYQKFDEIKIAAERFGFDSESRTVIQSFEDKLTRSVEQFNPDSRRTGGAA